MLVALSLQGMIAVFMDYCHSKQLRMKTLNSYEQSLKLFAKWINEQHGVENAEQVKEAHIRAYILDLQQRGKYTFCISEQSARQNHPANRRDYRQPISNITINNYLRNLRVFFNWLVESECIVKSPMEKIRPLPEERQPKAYLENDEVLRLLKSMDTSYYSEYRDLLIMMLMLDAGTRLSETLTAEISQLNIAQRSLLLPAEKTKGRKERTVFFSFKTAKELRRWLQFKDRYCDSPLLFPIRHSGHAMTVSNYETNFTRYIQRAGITKHISPHTLRNNFAKRCLMSGMDIYTLSRILGHSSVSVTEKAYLDVNDEDIRKRYSKFSPIDSIYDGAR